MVAFLSVSVLSAYTSMIRVLVENVTTILMYPLKELKNVLLCC